MECPMKARVETMFLPVKVMAKARNTPAVEAA